MPAVNWNVFSELPGSKNDNFEILCRQLISRHFAKYGDFRALANQPGVEFHLKLREPCSLGGPPRWFGWQCRWYDLPGVQALGTTRRAKIADAILKTEANLPKLTDWILWTRHPLTRGDQEWFYGLKTSIERLVLWTATDVEDLLSGDAEILRRTYFGELILTDDSLNRLHHESVAPIRRRWNREIHQEIDAERTLRRMLAEPGTWQDLRDFADQLLVEAEAVEVDAVDLPNEIKALVLETASHVRSIATDVSNSYSALEHGDLDMLREQILNRSKDVKLTTLAGLPRRLRARNHPAALTVTNALSDVRYANALFEEIAIYPSIRMIAVVAQAGCGKTELAAQITAGSNDRSPGILLHGRDLSATASLDELARSAVIQGLPVASIEMLVAALDAAGRRVHRRLPLAIDGLNEAEDPRIWKGKLSTLYEKLSGYPYVLLICTLRTAFANEALPTEIQRLEIPGFQEDTLGAIRKYFEYYRINASDAELPLDLLRHPLTLRLFCEVTNSARKSIVGIEAMPGSLVGLFDRYLEQASDRIADLSPNAWRFDKQNIRDALIEIGSTLWEEIARGVGYSALRERLGDDKRPWNASIVRALEHEGILLRAGERESNIDRVAVVYDALAGHLIADAILAKRNRDEMVEWLRESATVRSLGGPPEGRHPLASDILSALAGLFPRRIFGHQLWKVTDGPARFRALVHAADLEAEYLDAATVEEIRTLLLQSPEDSNELFRALWRARGAVSHPLNAKFLSVTLHQMPVAQRDMRWTEWVRRNHDEVIKDLKQIEESWYAIRSRSASDQLRAEWVSWTLTSTVTSIRDQATRTLYWFGRGDPVALFNLTVRGLAVNDSYVPQRLLASSYGVVMAHQLFENEFKEQFSGFLTELRRALVGSTASSPTSDWLARLYVQGCVDMARAYYTEAVPAEMLSDGKIHFASGPPVQLITREDARATELSDAMAHHYEDDTLGDVIGFRGHYTSKHDKEHPAASHVRGTMWSLGWRQTEIGKIDDALNRSNYRGQGLSVQRYAEKYAWIGLHTYPGMMDQYAEIWANGRPSDVQIDPSFPERPPIAPVEMPQWACSEPSDDESWVRHGVVNVPDELFRITEITSDPGPWIAAYGYLKSHLKTPNREVFGFLTTLLVDPKDEDRLVKELNSRDYPGSHWLPRAPEDHYTFAGEIPWSPSFARESSDDANTDMYRGQIKALEGPRIDTEILAHRFSWESYHSSLNQVGGAFVPSRSFSLATDLREVPQSFDQRLPDGSKAAISLRGPHKFEGNLLYLREDLVKQYANGRKLIWFIWGERQPHSLLNSRPGWLLDAYKERAMIWRRVVRAEELSDTVK
jgi:hypothetical protein